MERLRLNLLLFVFAAAPTPPCSADETLDTAAIISALIDVAEHADAEVRIAAFSALKRQPRSEQLLALFWRGLEDDDLRIRKLSLGKIVEFDGPTVRVLTRLISLEEKTTDIDDRLMAQAAQSHLTSIGAPAIPYLIESLKRDEANHYAAAALGEIPLGEYQTTVTTQLTALLKSEHKAAQLAAVRSLQSIMIADAEAKAKAKALAETGGIDPRYLAYYTKVLQKYDSNADGSLTKDEWSKMSKDPAAADKDQDGKISAAELAKWSLPAPK